MTRQAPTPTTASLAVVLPAALWGAVWWPLRYLDQQGVPGEWSIGFVNLVAALVLLPFLIFWFRQYRAHLGKAFLIGVATGTGITLYYLGIIHTSIIRATLFFYMTPIWATLIGIYWLKEPSTFRRWTAIGIGLVGLILLLSGDHIRAFNIGDFLAFLSGVSWAIGGAMLNRYNDVPFVASTFFQFLVAAVVIFPISLMVGILVVPDFGDFWVQTPVMIIAALVLFLPSILSIFWASQYLFPGRVGLLMMSEVLVAVISTSLLLEDEQLQFIHWIGAALIIIAGIVELTPARKKTESPPIK
ncbi:MAG: DMT family transporter [Hyphomicrobiales bacterium]